MIVIVVVAVRLRQRKTNYKYPSKSRQFRNTNISLCGAFKGSKSSSEGICSKKTGERKHLLRRDELVKFLT